MGKKYASMRDVLAAIWLRVAVLAKAGRSVSLPLTIAIAAEFSAEFGGQRPADIGDEQITAWIDELLEKTRGCGEKSEELQG